MKKFLLGLVLLSMTACGYHSRDNEANGQVKKVVKNTPILCPDYTTVDVSLGVMRNGVGSMSTEDIWLVVNDKSLVDKLKTAAESGKLVRIVYDVKRVTFCKPNMVLTEVNVLE